jgi:O-antigen ligase
MLGRQVNRERIDRWCERGIWGLILAVLVVGPLAAGAARAVDFLLLQVLTLAVAVLWSVRLWLNPGQRLFWPPIGWAVLAFVGYTVIRYFQADLEWVARRELIRVLVYAFVFFAILNNLNRQGAPPLVAYTLIFLGMVIAGYAVYQYATDSPRVGFFLKPANYAGRGSGTYICPNHLAGFLEMVLPLGMAFLLMGRVSVLMRVLLGYASLVMLTGIAVTFSRGGWAATGFSLLLFIALLLRKGRYRFQALILLLVLIASGWAFATRSFYARKRIERLFVEEKAYDGFTYRNQLWKSAFDMWQDHRWLGAGPGHFDYRFGPYRPPRVQSRPGYAHNDYLNLLADWGLVGGVIITGSLALLAIGVRRTWKYVRREDADLGAKRSQRAAFVFGASVGLAALLVHSFSDFNMQIPANALLAISLVALLSGQLRFATDRYWVKCGWLSRGLLTVLLLVGAAYLGQQANRALREEALLRQVRSERWLTSTRVKLLEQAVAAEPTNFDTTYTLAETLRQMSWQGGDDYRELAQRAMSWYQRGISLNPFDAYNYMKLGMCLDWLGRHEEAAPWFEQAILRDPNSYYVLAHQGWHFVQVEDYAAAKGWFERSLRLKRLDNPIALRYLAIVNQKLKEPASKK